MENKEYDSTLSLSSRTPQRKTPGRSEKTPGRSEKTPGELDEVTLNLFLTPEKLSAVKRVQLQRYCKRYGIKANLKNNLYPVYNVLQNIELINKLQEYALNIQNQDNQSQDCSESSEAVCLLDDNSVDQKNETIADFKSRLNNEYSLIEGSATIPDSIEAHKASNSNYLVESTTYFNQVPPILIDPLPPNADTSDCARHVTKVSDTKGSEIEVFATAIANISAPKCESSVISTLVRKGSPYNFLEEPLLKDNSCVKEKKEELNTLFSESKIDISPESSSLESSGTLKAFSLIDGEPLEHQPSEGSARSVSTIKSSQTFLGEEFLPDVPKFDMGKEKETSQLIKSSNISEESSFLKRILAVPMRRLSIEESQVSDYSALTVEQLQPDEDSPFICTTPIISKKTESSENNSPDVIKSTLQPQNLDNADKLKGVLEPPQSKNSIQSFRAFLFGSPVKVNDSTEFSEANSPQDKKSTSLPSESQNFDNGDKVKDVLELAQSTNSIQSFDPSISSPPLFVSPMKVKDSTIPSGTNPLKDIESISRSSQQEINDTSQNIKGDMGSSPNIPSIETNDSSIVSQAITKVIDVTFTPAVVANTEKRAEVQNSPSPDIKKDMSETISVSCDHESKEVFSPNQFEQKPQLDQDSHLTRAKNIPKENSCIQNKSPNDLKSASRPQQESSDTLQNIKGELGTSLNINSVKSNNLTVSQPFVFASPMKVDNATFQAAAATIIADMEKRVIDVKELFIPEIKKCSGENISTSSKLCITRTSNQGCSPNRFAKIHRKQFEKMPSILTHYGAQRRKGDDFDREREESPIKRKKIAHLIHSHQYSKISQAIFKNEVQNKGKQTGSSKERKKNHPRKQSKRTEKIERKVPIEKKSNVTSVTKSGITARLSTFNLEESLKKPLSYVPYRGIVKTVTQSVDEQKVTEKAHFEKRKQAAKSVSQPVLERQKSQNNIHNERKQESISVSKRQDSNQTKKEIGVSSVSVIQHQNSRGLIPSLPKQSTLYRQSSMAKKDDKFFSGSVFRPHVSLEKLENNGNKKNGDCNKVQDPKKKLASDLKPQYQKQQKRSQKFIASSLVQKQRQIPGQT
ncbi:hypothetical protein G9A89_011878 [Geosiphon pyriformis]|nr:hypothetical protein G9A89_011878 [Geosiphon pyriformis]